MNELSTERAIEALHTIRAYYACLTAGYPKGKDRRGIGDVMCSEIANSCLMAIKALEQTDVTDINVGGLISRQAVIGEIADMYDEAKKWGNEAKDDEIKTQATACMSALIEIKLRLKALPSVEPERKTGKWIDNGIIGNTEAHNFVCSECGWKEPDFPERIGELHYCTSCGAKMEVET